MRLLWVIVCLPLLLGPGASASVAARGKVAPISTWQRFEVFATTPSYAPKNDPASSDSPFLLDSDEERDEDVPDDLFATFDRPLSLVSTFDCRNSQLAFINGFARRGATRLILSLRC